MAAAAAWVDGWVDERLDRPGGARPGRADRVRGAEVERAGGAEEIERRCAAQGPARAAGSLRRVLAALAGRFQALRGWERIGYVRAGDSTRERLGLSACELADLARVDTALRRLPRLEAALVSCELPWTKVRLVARAADLERYAAERLGFSPRKCWALLRIERLARRAPALLRAYREGEISWVQAQALVRIVGMAPDHAGRWVAFARRVSVRRLRDDVDRALLLADRDAGAFAQTGGVPDLEAELAAVSDAEAERVRLQTGANTREVEGTPQEAEPETSRAFFTAPRDVARLFRATLATVQRRLGAALGRPATLSDALDAMLEHCFEAWGTWAGRRSRPTRRGTCCSRPGRSRPV
jgi:hypothetical protein